MLDIIQVTFILHIHFLVPPGSVCAYVGVLHIRNDVQLCVQLGKIRKIRW